MEDYTIKEAAKELDISDRLLYDWIKRIEAGTPYRFERVFLGKYFMGKPRKQLVISDGDLEKLKHFWRLMHIQNMGMPKALLAVFFQDI